MKIAVCYSGLSDSLNHNGYLIDPNESYNSLKSHFEKFDIDIFFHTWESNYQNKEIQESNLINLLNPRSYIIQKPLFTDLPDVKFRTKNRWFSQKKTIELFESYSNNNNIKYDLVIVSRFDCSYYNFINLKKIKKDTLYLAKWIFPHNISGYLDYWSFGDPKTISNLKGIYSSLENEFFQKDIYSNHVILKKYLSHNNINVLNVLKEHKDFKLTSREYSKAKWYSRVFNFIIFIKELINDKK